MKANIIAQLDAANERIKVLEARLERVKAETPSRHLRRRPQPRLNGYGSNQSLLSSSVGSSSMISSGSRPRPSRQGSSFLTPDREADLRTTTPLVRTTARPRVRSRSIPFRILLRRRYGQVEATVAQYRRRE